MAFLDPTANFARTTLSVGITSIATTMTLTSGTAFPDPDVAPYNVVIWNETDYPAVYNDPNVEIVRVTSETAGVYTIARAQEGTSAAAHNTVGKTYGVILTFTDKMRDDIEAQLQGKTGTAIASATTTDIGASAGQNVHITGTTTITGLGTANAGVYRRVEFDGALTLTHNATSLILPGSANITTAAGDVAYFVSLGSGNWKCEAYNKKSGEAVVSGGGGGWTTIGTIDFTSDGFTHPSFTGIPTTYKMLKIEFVAFAVQANSPQLRLQFNNRTTAGNYRYAELKAENSTWSNLGVDSNASYIQVGVLSTNGGEALVGSILISNNAFREQGVMADAARFETNGGFQYKTSARFTISEQITSIQLFHKDGNETNGGYRSGTHFRLLGLA